MAQEPNDIKGNGEEAPPFLGSWSKVYTLVLVSHLITVALFVLLTLFLA